MKKSDLKELIKPLVKECIHEVLLEEGLLSNVVSEVAKGLHSGPIITEQVEQAPAPTPRKRKKDYSKEIKLYYRLYAGPLHYGLLFNVDLSQFFWM